MLDEINLQYLFNLNGPTKIKSFDVIGFSDCIKKKFNLIKCIIKYRTQIRPSVFMARYNTTTNACK